jgi:two-component system cell cycle response regulator
MNALTVGGDFIPGNFTFYIISLGDCIQFIKRTSLNAAEFCWPMRDRKRMNGKILIIEEDRKDVKLLKDLLRDRNLEIFEAKDAESGFDKLKEHFPCLIFLNLRLPGMDGLTAARRIKQDPELKNINVVALSGIPSQGEKEKAFEAGCDGYLPKPIGVRSFQELIDRFLHTRDAKKSPQIDQYRSHKKKILIIDDETVNRRVLEAMLPPGNFEVYTASDGVEGLRKVYELYPDVILMDVLMPGKDGFTLTKELKKNPAVQNIPIILVTALDGSENRVSGLEAGAEEYLTKPVKTVELLSRVQSMLQLKEYRDQLSLRKQSQAFFTRGEDEGKSETQNLEKTPSVLLIEDNPVDAGVVIKVLEREPLQLETVKRGEAAIKRILAGGIDLVLLDILLPDIDGFDICKKLKSMDEAKDIPIIVITCLDDIDSRINSVKLGVDDFLVKPINHRELKARIKVLLEKKGQLDELRSHYAQALNSAVIDSLTGLYNHGYFKNFLHMEIKRSQRQSYPVCLLMVDIDDFKRCNDTLGHSVGDKILKKVGSIIKGEVREVDLTARYGGDEFTVVLPYSDKSGAVKVTTRIQKSIAAARIAGENPGMKSAVTVSIGIAEYPTDAVSLEDLIRKADKMLYEAKKQGKNQVCIWGD